MRSDLGTQGLVVSAMALGCMGVTSFYSTSDEAESIAAGYRIPVGDRLTFRADGRYTRFTSEFSGDEGNVLAFTLSIGGLFGGQQEAVGGW